MRLLKSEFLLGICGTLLIFLTGLGVSLPQPVIGQFGIGYGIQLDYFVGLGCVQGLIYFVAIVIVLREKTVAHTFWIILGCALAVRLIATSFPPFLSNDLYRYIWDGRVQASGINPYRYIPNDPHLASLRDVTIFPHINRANYAHTIYPPAAEMIFLLISKLTSWLFLPLVFAMKLAMVAFEGIAIWAIVRLLHNANLPRSRVLIYAWNPVPIWEFSGSGHVDAIAVCFVALALLAVSYGKRSLGALALVAAVLTKFLPLVLFPALWRRWDWKFGMIFLGAAILLYLPYLGVGKGVFGFLGGYGAQEGINSGNGIFLLSIFGQIAALPDDASKIYLVLLALILVAVSLTIIFGRLPSIPEHDPIKIISKHALLLGGILMAGLSPHYPWYYCWLLVPACVMPRWSILYLVTASLLLYLNPIHTKLVWPAFLYGPFLALAVRDLWQHRATPKENGLQMIKGDPV